jgi:hypothetical protein
VQALTSPKIINKRSTINEAQVFEPWINLNGIVLNQQVLNTIYQAPSIAIKKIASEIKVLLAMMCMALAKKRYCQRYLYTQEKNFCCYSPITSEEQNFASVIPLSSARYYFPLVTNVPPAIYYIFTSDELLFASDLLTFHQRFTHLSPATFIMPAKF